MGTISEQVTQLEYERNSYANTLVELRELLEITDNEVWTQTVLKEKLDRLAELEGTAVPAKDA